MLSSISRFTVFLLISVSINSGLQAQFRMDAGIGCCLLSQSGIVRYTNVATTPFTRELITVARTTMHPGITLLGSYEIIELKRSRRNYRLDVITGIKYYCKRNNSITDYSYNQHSFLNAIPGIVQIPVGLKLNFIGLGNHLMGDEMHLSLGSDFTGLNTSDELLWAIMPSMNYGFYIGRLGLDFTFYPLSIKSKFEPGEEYTDRLKNSFFTVDLNYRLIR